MTEKKLFENFNFDNPYANSNELVLAMQEFLNKENKEDLVPDAMMGTKTIKAMQRYFRVKDDGLWYSGSRRAAKAYLEELNSQKSKDQKIQTDNSKTEQSTNHPFYAKWFGSDKYDSQKNKDNGFEESEDFLMKRKINSGIVSFIEDKFIQKAKTLDPTIIETLLNPRINNIIRKNLGLKEVDNNETNPDKLLSDEFNVKLGQKVLPEGSLVSKGLTNTVLRHALEYEWKDENNQPFKLTKTESLYDKLTNNKFLKSYPFYALLYKGSELYNKKFKDDSRVNYVIWKNGYATDRYGNNLNQREMEEKFIKYNPNHKNTFKEAWEEEDKKWIDLKNKNNDLKDFLTPAQKKKNDVLFKNAVATGYNQDKTAYTEATFHFTPHMGDDASANLIALYEQRPVTVWGKLNGKRDWVLPNRGYKIYGNALSNNRVKWFAASNGFRTAGENNFISTYNPESFTSLNGKYNEVKYNKSQKKYMTDNNISRVVAFRNPNFSLSQTYITNLPQSNSEEGLYNKAIKSNETLDEMRDKYFWANMSMKLFPKIYSKIRSTSGGDIPDFLNKLNELKYNNNTQSISKGKETVAYLYDPNGLGNFAVKFNKQGKAEHLVDNQNWMFDIFGIPVHLGARGQGVVAQKFNDNYYQEFLDKYDKFKQQMKEIRKPKKLVLKEKGKQYEPNLKFFSDYNEKEGK